MAEPDILVNFDFAPVNSAFVAPSINGIRGGRWKDRFRAKKQLQYKQKKANRTYNGSRTDSDGQVEGEFNVNHGPNSQDQDGDKKKHQLLKRKRGNEQNAGGNAHDATSQSKGDRPVISSIFSSNPKPAARHTLQDL